MGTWQNTYSSVEKNMLMQYLVITSNVHLATKRPCAFIIIMHAHVLEVRKCVRLYV